MTTLRLTYDELGERIGRSAEGARMLARRRRWRVEKGNDGKARVVVSEAELVVRPTGRPLGQPAVQTPGDQVLEGLTAELRTLRTDRDRLVAQLIEAKERAAGSEGEARALRDALADLSRRLDDATLELTYLRRPWWHRLFGR